MKKIIKLITVAFSTVILLSCAEVQNSSEVVITGGMQYNESTFAYDGGLLIANFGCAEFNSLNDEGKGYIAMLKDGKVSTFIPAGGYLSAPKGMLVKDGYLLVCDVNKVVAFDLSNLSATPQVLQFPEGEFFVNDIDTDGTNIYVSVTNSGNIFKIDASDLTNFANIEIGSPWFNIVGANGIVLSDSSLFVASYPTDKITKDVNVIYKISNLDNPTSSKVSTKAGQWDGLALSADKSTLYSSSWSPAEIVAIDLASGAVESLNFETEFIGAADFTLLDGKLYIPDLPNSSIIIKELK